MATKEDRIEVSWASFCANVRMSTQSSEMPAIAANDSTKLFMGEIRGVTHLIIEDAALPYPASIPWTNVACVGWAPKSK